MPSYLMTINGRSTNAFDKENYQPVSYGIIAVHGGFGSIQISTERG